MIDGKWQGYYVNPYDLNSGSRADLDEHTFAISAIFAVDHSRLTGTMLDEDIEQEYAYERLLEVLRSQLTQREIQHSLNVLQRFPEMRVRASLAPESRLLGTVHGSEVRFEKRYVGDVTQTFLFDAEHSQTLTRPGGRVEYVGEIVDKDVIDGRWVIKRTGLQAFSSRPALEGSFRLYRIP